MAIKKVITDDKGQTTSYHRIVAFAPVFINGQEILSVNLSGYTSEEYRQIEKTSGENKQVSSVGVTLPLFPDDHYSREKIYTEIMALPEWEGSSEI